MDVSNYINAQTIALVRRVDSQASLEGYGQVKQGAQSISQSILIAISNRKGSDPFRPTFGSDIWEHIDRPINEAAPLISSAIRKSVDAWVPEIDLSDIEYKLDDPDVTGQYNSAIFSVYWKLKGGSLQARTEVVLGIGEQDENDLINDVSEAVTIEILSTEVLTSVIQIT